MKNYSRRKFNFKHVILGIMCIVFLTVIANAVTSRVYWFLDKKKQDPNAGFSHWPHPFTVFRAKANVPGKTNEFGWYGASVPVKTKPRILFMGNSVVQGNWEDANDKSVLLPTMQKPLEEFFLKNKMAVDPLAAGYASFNSSQLLTIFIHEAIESKPDLVVFLDGYLDFYYPFGLEARVGYPYKFKNVEGALHDQNVIGKKIVRSLSLFDAFLMKLSLPKLLSGSDFERLVLEKSNLALSENGSEDKMLKKEAGENITPYCERIIQNWKKEYFFAKGQGIETLFVLQPTIRTSDEERGYACLREKIKMDPILKERFIDFDQTRPLSKTEYKDMIHPATLLSYNKYVTLLAKQVTEHAKFKEKFSTKK